MGLVAFCGNHWEFRSPESLEISGACRSTHPRAGIWFRKKAAARTFQISMIADPSPILSAQITKVPPTPINPDEPQFGSRLSSAEQMKVQPERRHQSTAPPRG
jgi:hypothetical protein